MADINELDKRKPRSRSYGRQRSKRQTLSLTSLQPPSKAALGADVDVATVDKC